jgi:hypothetical protein
MPTKVKLLAVVKTLAQLWYDGKLVGLPDHVQNLGCYAHQLLNK